MTSTQEAPGIAGCLLSVVVPAVTAHKQPDAPRRHGIGSKRLCFNAWYRIPWKCWLTKPGARGCQGAWPRSSRNGREPA